MKTLISNLALATILAAPLAASADPSAPATNATTTQPKTVVMQQATPSNTKPSNDDRQSVRRLEDQSRQLGPTN